MPCQDPRHWAKTTRFDPNEAIVIRQPPGEGPGFWAGAPSVMFDEETQTFLLVYRLRRPRGVHPDRGAEIRVARSSDGIEFDDIWSGQKNSLGTTSIERCALIRMPQGHWGLFISFVDPVDGRWRIDIVEADAIVDFDLSNSKRVLTAGALGVEGVKDPFLFQIAGLYHMVVSFATGEAECSVESMHGTHDAYNTGLIKSRTGLATSDDGRVWKWEGEIFGPSELGWDKYCARIGTLWCQDGVWLALYDGSADVSENYEERCGLAYAFDLRSFHRITRRAPLMQQPHASGALRYVDVLHFSEKTYVYFEAARADGSHDLRVLRK